MSVSDASREPEALLSSNSSLTHDGNQELQEFNRALSPFSPRFFALLSVVTVVFGRGLAPALPGSRAGIDIWITRFETGSAKVPALAAWLTQLTLISGIWLCSLLLQRALSERGSSAFFRLLAVVATPSLLALVGFLNVTRGELGSLWLVSVAGICAIWAGVCAIWAMRCQTTRAAGLVLMLVTLGGTINVGARVLALFASEQARAFDFTFARMLSSAGFTLDVAATLVALGWLWVKPSKGKIIGLVALFATASFLVLTSSQSALDGNFWQVLIARTLDELTTHPDPLVILPIRNFFELLSLGVSLAVLFKSGTPILTRAAVSLALASRGNIDMPLCALMLTSSALLAALPAVILRTLRPRVNGSETP